MAERSILAYFKRPEEAEKALAQMKSLQVVDSAIDRFDGYAGDGDEGIGNTMNGEISSLGNLTLDGDYTSRDAGILGGAHVSASGYSSGGPENRVTGYDILLTVVIEEEDYDKAMRIVRQEGAL